MASEWQTAVVVSHKMPWCALLTADKNYNKGLENCQDFFSETKTMTKYSRPRLHDPRPRLSFLSSKRLETNTLVSRTASLPSSTRRRSAWVIDIDWLIGSRIFRVLWSSITSPRTVLALTTAPFPQIILSF